MLLPAIEYAAVAALNSAKACSHCFWSVSYRRRALPDVCILAFASVNCLVMPASLSRAAMSVASASLLSGVPTARETTTQTASLVYAGVHFVLRGEGRVPLLIFL